VFKSKFLLAAAVFSIVPNMAMATTIYDTFGAFPDATWGGSGIPNDAVAVSRQIVNGDVTITVAMSATQRFSNPTLGNDGAGTYFAGVGSNFGGNNESSSEGALWNFNYYINVDGINGATPVLTDYQFDLLYDLDPADNTPIGSLGIWDLTATVNSVDPSLTLAEDSQNLMFSFLTTGVPGFVTAPGGVFDPNATGNYQFAIQVSGGGFNLETVAMEVQVVPVPAALWLFGSGMLGLIGIARRKKS
jgi:hypothetical protein